LGFLQSKFFKKQGRPGKKIGMLDKNVNLVNNLKQKAFIRVTKLYTWEKVIADYDKLFKTLSHE